MYLRRSRRSRPGRQPISVGIDIGSTNTKIVVADVAAPGTAHASISFTTPDDPLSLVDRTRLAIHQALARSGGTPVAVGIASMAETGVPLDRDWMPIGPLVRWNAARAPAQRNGVVDRLGADALYAATGVPPIRKTPLVMLDELRDAEPDRWARLMRWSGVADLVTRALTDRFVTDHTLAGRSLAYSVPDPSSALPRVFDAAILGEIGLAPENLPAVVAPGEVAGHVTREASSRTGLAKGIPVYVAGHDHAVGAWGAGVRDPGRRADSVGTSEVLLRVARDRVDRPSAFAAGMSVNRSVDGDRELLVAGSAAAGSLIADLLAGRFSDGRPIAPEMLANVAGPAQIMLLPYPLGRQSPATDPEATLEFVDLNGREVRAASLSSAQLAHAVLIGLCLQLRWMADEQSLVLEDRGAGTITLIGGGGARLDSWLRLKADVMRVGFDAVAAPEPVAMAAAHLAAVRAGAGDAALSLPAVSAAVPSRADHDPHAAAHDAFVSAATSPTNRSRGR